jgi:transcription initiation factor TFIIB
VRTIAIRDIYETGFDEDIQMESSANQCSECDGRVTTNAVETVCEDCGLVIDEQRIDHGPEWRACDEDERERTGAPLTAARHDRGLSTEIGHGTDAHENELSGQKRRRLPRMRCEQTRGRWRSKVEQNLAPARGVDSRACPASRSCLVTTRADRFSAPEGRICLVEIHRSRHRGECLSGLSTQ